MNFGSGIELIIGHQICGIKNITFDHFHLN